MGVEIIKKDIGNLKQEENLNNILPCFFAEIVTQILNGKVPEDKNVIGEILGVFKDAILEILNSNKFEFSSKQKVINFFVNDINELVKTDIDILKAIKKIIEENNLVTILRKDFFDLLLILLQDFGGSGKTFEALMEFMYKRFGVKSKVYRIKENIGSFILYQSLGINENGIVENLDLNERNKEGLELKNIKKGDYINEVAALGSKYFIMYKTNEGGAGAIKIPMGGKKNRPDLLWVFGDKESNPKIIEKIKKLTLDADGILLKALKEKLKYIYSKYRDPLTGLYNKSYIDYMGEKLIQKSVISIDLNLFKQINDNYGHAAGNILLQDFAMILLDAAKRESDKVGRVGGDEFVLLISHDINENKKETIEGIVRSIENGVAEYNKTKAEIGKTIGFTSGYAIYGEMGKNNTNTLTSYPDLLLEADINMLGNKDGKGIVCRITEIFKEINKPEIQLNAISALLDINQNITENVLLSFFKNKPEELKKLLLFFAGSSPNILKKNNRNFGTE
ncbi:MAG: GGDEF domain-containing protein [Candidatus Gracilibacteria bacterium]|nr:GGDEF domain-containing protein [Candidatus Gracilibacteria bacterium]MDD3120610.1 GGDEF domain-containing protein [Candidatus Gracilibacteria bacterium]